MAEITVNYHLEGPAKQKVLTLADGDLSGFFYSLFEKAMMNYDVLDGYRVVVDDTDNMSESLQEANKHLKGESLVLALTSACMVQWYQVVNKFSAKPEVYDVAPAKTHDSYNIIKMSPGVDVRDDTYQFLQDTTSKLTKTLNRLLGKDVFEPKIQRGSDSLEALVAFTEARGGVFQVKASMDEGSTSIFLTMPKEDQLQLAFSKMTGTPHMDDGLVDDEMGEPDGVAGDAVPEYEPEEHGVDVEEPVSDFEVDPVEPEESEFDYEEPRAFGEGFATFFSKNTNDDDEPEEELEEQKDAFKVSYDDNGVEKEKIVDSEQEAEQEARRHDGKVVSAEVEENVSVGAAMGTAAEPTVYVPNAGSGWTNGPFSSLRKRND